ncbi:MAG: DUF1028 domain-containing protein [Streptosporangiales bacterium]|nr:DUF1028 domain-containing protein [Streptosporangiales bacterium]
MTYSIVARDEQTGELGCAVQSHFFSVGPIVPWVEAGVGAVATQAQAEISYGPLGLDRMRAGEPACEALAALVAADGKSAHRQVAMVDAQGRVATHTGAMCIREAGHRQGDGVSVQANMMLRDTVPDAMVRAYESASGDLADRLLAALDAAQAEGGDIRGRQSAAIVVAAGDPSGRPWQDRRVDLRVEDHPDPLAELRRLVQLRRAYDAIDRAEHAGLRGDLATATAEYAKAEAASVGNVEPAFWFGVGIAMSGDVERARKVLAGPFAAHDGWKELLRRLPAAGMFPDDTQLIDRLLE